MSMMLFLFKENVVAKDEFKTIPILFSISFSPSEIKLHEPLASQVETLKR